MDQAKEIVNHAIDSCDIDGNGMLNGREVIKTIKAAIKSYFG